MLCLIHGSTANDQSATITAADVSPKLETCLSSSIVTNANNNPPEVYIPDVVIGCYVIEESVLNEVEVNDRLFPPAAFFLTLLTYETAPRHSYYRRSHRIQQDLRRDQIYLQSGPSILANGFVHSSTT